MSDFDKEAEREKLREQLEEEEESRQHTQRMSELLLKGATMTNSHCDNCGDPIFRYDGQEFCPTCQAAGQAAGNGQEQAAAGETAAEPAETAGSADANATDQLDRTDAASGTAETERGGEASPADVGAPSAAPGARAEPPDRSSSAAAAATVSGDGDVAAAADALRATLTKFAAKAAETDDPGRAREYLAAAREAAEALDALPY